MEASKEGEMPSEQAPEVLPEEIKEEKPKSMKLLAVVIAVIIIVAAIAAAFGLGLIGGKKEKANIAPSCGARATSDTTVGIGVAVNFTSTATDSDGTVANYTWYFGDGTVVSGPTMSSVSHTYVNGGNYWILHSVVDDKGATADTEAAMIKVIVVYYDPDPEGSTDWTNATAPYAVLSSDKDIIANNTLVTFNMTGCIGIGGWTWVNASNHSKGQNRFYGIANVTAMVLDFGDGSATVNVNTTTLVATHTYTASGHYAAKLTVNSSNNGNAVSTTVMRTIHVLNPQVTVGNIKNPDALIEATFGEPTSVDPAICYESAGYEVMLNVYETLVWYDGGAAARLVPYLATAVPSLANGLITNNGLNYTFNLRQGVKFHDGTNMTADDVAYSLQRVLRVRDSSSPSWMLEQLLTDYAGLSYYGKTVSKYLDGSYNVSWLRAVLEPLGYSHVINDTDLKNIAEAAVVKVNATAVTFRLTHEYPGFLFVMAYTPGYITKKSWVEANGGLHPGVINEYVRTHAMGTGPYKLVNWEQGSKIYMTRYDGYWGPAPKLKDFYIIKSNDVNTRILMLQAGDADVIQLAVTYESTFAGKPEYRITKGLSTFDQVMATFNFNINSTKANSQYGTNVTDDFFQDVHMRRAFSHLFNFTQFINNVYMSNGQQPNGPIPQGLFGYSDAIPKQEYNLTMAEAEFKLAINPATGRSWWVDGFNIPLSYNAGNTYRKTACEMIKATLEGLAPGRMTAEIVALDWPIYKSEVFFNSNSFAALYVIGWGPDYADPDDFITPELHSVVGSYPVYTGYANTSLDTLIEAAAVELNLTVRAQMYANITWACYNDTPYIWLAQPNNFHVERSWMRGWQYNPMYSTEIYAATCYKA